MSRNAHHVLWALCGLALLARVAAIVALKAWEHPNAIEHASIAANLLRGDGFAFGDFGYYGPSSMQSPPYPLFLAGLYLVFGIRSAAAFAVALGVNAVVGALGAWLTCRVGQTLGASTRASLTAAALYAIWPTQVYAVTAAQAITMITVAMLAMVYLFHRAIDTQRMGPWVAFSIIGCLGALTEPILLPPMLLTGMALSVWPWRWPWRRRLRFALVLLVAGILILGPWTLRNYVVHGTLMPVKSTFWVNVWKGNNPNATGTDRLPLTEEQRRILRDTPLWQRHRLARSEEFDQHRQYDRLTQEQVERLWGKPDAEREEVFREYAGAWIREHPGRYLQLCGLRFVKTVWLELGNPHSWNIVYMASRTVLLIGTVVGLVVAIRQRWRLGYVFLLLGTGILLVTLTVTAARFGLPYEPFQLLLTGAALMSLSRYTQRRPATAQPD